MTTDMEFAFTALRLQHKGIPHIPLGPHLGGIHRVYPSCITDAVPDPILVVTTGVHDNEREGIQALSPRVFQQLAPQHIQGYSLIVPGWRGSPYHACYPICSLELRHTLAQSCSYVSNVHIAMRRLRYVPALMLSEQAAAPCESIVGIGLFKIAHIYGSCVLRLYCTVT